MHGNLGKTFRVKHALISNRKNGSHNPLARHMPRSTSHLVERRNHAATRDELRWRWHILSHTFDVDGTDSHESDSKRAIEFLHAHLRTSLAWHTQTSTLIRSWRNNKNLTTNVSTQPTLTHCHKDDNQNQRYSNPSVSHTTWQKNTFAPETQATESALGIQHETGLPKSKRKNHFNVPNKEHEPLLAKLESGCTPVTTE